MPINSNTNEFEAWIGIIHKLEGNRIAENLIRNAKFGEIRMKSSKLIRKVSWLYVIIFGCNYKFVLCLKFKNYLVIKIELFAGHLNSSLFYIFLSVMEHHNMD